MAKKVSPENQYQDKVQELNDARKNLFNSEEKFKLLVESVTDYAIFLLDPEGYIQSWNPGAERFKGYKAHEAIGKHFSIFYTQEDIQRKHPQYELEIAKAKGRFEEEGWRVRKDAQSFGPTSSSPGS
jgi:PAS domain S-box-containing protein